jgi:hypothetical protein
MTRHPGPFRAVIGIDGLQQERAVRSLKKVLFRKEAGTGSKPEDVQQVGNRLQAAGAEVLILNRLTGKASHLSGVRSQGSGVRSQGRSLLVLTPDS